MEMCEDAELCRTLIAKDLCISKRCLKYIGYTDSDVIKKGTKLFQYNIVLKGHERYKSTVSMMK